MFDEIKADRRRLYENVLKKYGDSPQGADWADADSQKLRFKILSEIDDLNGKGIHDVALPIW